MEYSLFAGGKRIRPVLALMVADLLQIKGIKAKEDILSIALSLECIHTYSLIHDDLPAMDDDDLRRGKPTNHIKFNEALAILAGDGLLTHCFYILSRINNYKNLSPLIKLISECSGAQGMVGGQVLDMAATNTNIKLQKLQNIHRCKTGALIRAACLAVPTYTGDKKAIKILDIFSRHLGLLFQIVDDILDCTLTDEQLGKPAGSDKINNKSTYVSLLGLSGAKKKAEQVFSQALESLSNFPTRADRLRQLTSYVFNRKE